MRIRLLGLGTFVFSLAILFTVTLAAASTSTSDSFSGTFDDPTTPSPSARAYPGWLMVNEPGFGDPRNGVYALGVLNGVLYAGVSNGATACIWSSPTGDSWSKVVIPGWTAGNSTIYVAERFGGYLYFGVMNETVGAEIWRTNGETWEKVVQGGLGDASTIAVTSLKEFGGYLYAFAGNLVSGPKIFSSQTGAQGSWFPINVPAMGGAGTFPESTMDVYSGYLYAGFGRNNQAELWRSHTGADWTPILTGSKTTTNTHVTSMAEYSGTLYIGFRNTTGGAQIWRTTDANIWQKVVSTGLGRPDNKGAYGLFVFQSKLYVVMMNHGGAQVWRSSNGTGWEGLALDGWGGGGAFADYFDKAAVIFNSQLYIGTVDGPGGGEIWKKTITPYMSAGPKLMGPPPLLVHFTNTSAGDYTMTRWDFGDGATGTGSPVSHTYTAIGTYTVTLTVSDGVITVTRAYPLLVATRLRTFLPVIISNR